MRTKHQFRIRDASLDRQPESRSSLVREILERIVGQTNKRLQISILHFHNFTTPATFTCWKIRFKTEVCTCSHLWKPCCDQRSRDCWISGWSKIFPFYKRNSWTRYWSTRCGNCFNTDQNHPECPLQEKRSVWKKWKLKKKTASSV